MNTPTNSVTLLALVLLISSCGSKSRETAEPPGSGSAVPPVGLELAATFQVNHELALDDGSADPQRFFLNNLKVTFEDELDLSSLDESAVAVVNDKDETIGVSVDKSVSDGKTILVITFNSETHVNEQQSLVDGSYFLTIAADSILTTNGLSPSEDITFGYDEEDKFYRLYGDADGNRLVDWEDFEAFQDVYGKPQGHWQYSAYWDVDRSGMVDDADADVFRANLGKMQLVSGTETFGDLDRDGSISDDEASAMLAAFETSEGEAGYISGFDSNANGTIDDNDYTLFRRLYMGEVVVAPVFGDFDEDGDCDSADLVVTLVSYELSAGDPTYDARADYNGDDTVDFPDLFALLREYGDEPQIMASPYGNADGDFDLDSADEALFSAAYGTNSGDSGYLEILDANLDGAIDDFDLGLFRITIEDPTYTP